MRLKFLKYLLLAAVIMAACDTVHEFPEAGKGVDPTVIQTVVKVECRINLSGIKVVSKDAGPLEEDVPEKYDRRFFVEIRSAEYADSVVEFHQVIRPSSDTTALTIDTKLQARKYNIFVWMDFILKGTETDYYYYTGNGMDLGNIHILEKEKYMAGSDFKDVQSYQAEIDLTPYAGQWYADITIQAPMQRPVAKITFLADDLDKYAENIGSTASLEEIASRMRTTFNYNGYLPSGYNAYTGRLNDSQTGYFFVSKAFYPSLFQEHNYTLVGSDYVFVNGESSSVTVSAIIRDSDGNIVNQVDNIVVPIERGKETVVKYHFFTKEYVPGIGIDSEFDGEFNVYV